LVQRDWRYSYSFINTHQSGAFSNSLRDSASENQFFQGVDGVDYHIEFRGYLFVVYIYTCYYGCLEAKYTTVTAISIFVMYILCKRRLMMKRKIWLAAGIAGMLLGNLPVDAHAELNIRLGDLHVRTGDRPRFVIDTRPTFIYLQGQGFSVAVGSPYDMLFYDDLYYVYYGGEWYSSSYYRGPWVLIRQDRLPYQIRRHRWTDIRRYRDVEYRKHDHRYWEERDRQFDNGRRGDRDQRDRRDFNERRDQPERRDSWDRRDQPDRREFQDRRDQPERRDSWDRRDQPDRREFQDRRDQSDRRDSRDRSDQSDRREFQDRRDQPGQRKQPQDQPKLIDQKKPQDQPKPADQKKPQEQPKPADQKKIQEQPKPADQKKSQDQSKPDDKRKSQDQLKDGDRPR
jgi:hypothetical protein